MTTPRTYPIIRVEQLPPWWTFPPRPVPTPSTALVLIRNRQPDIALTVGSRSTLSWREWSQYQSIVWVDTSERLLQFDCQLPTKSLGLDFLARASITYMVNNPVEVVRWLITNPRAQIETQATQLMQEISRQHTMFECAAAEQAMRDAILNALGSGDVVVTRCTITLDVEQEERDFARRTRAAERNYLQSIQHASYRQAVDPLHAALDQNMITFYNNMSQPGYAQFLLLHLANNRDQVQAVLEELNKQREQDRAHWLKMLDTLRQNDALEPDDWETLRKVVIERLVEAPYSGATNGSAPTLNAASVGGSNPPPGGPNRSPNGGPAPANPDGGTSSAGNPTAAHSTISGVAQSSASSRLASPVEQPAQSPPLEEREVGR